jgi:hypothetical protein
MEYIAQKHIKPTLIVHVLLMSSEWTFEKITHIRDCIERFSHFNQLAILKILHKYPSVILNENNYGILVNLSELPDEVIAKIDTHVQYIYEQERLLEVTERKKDEYKSIYFNGPN